MKGKWKTFLLEHLVLLGFWVAYALTFIFALILALGASLLIMKALLNR